MPSEPSVEPTLSLAELAAELDEGAESFAATVDPHRFPLEEVLAGWDVTGDTATAALADRVEGLWADGEADLLSGEAARLWEWVESDLGAEGLCALLARGGDRARLTGLVLGGCDFLVRNSHRLRRYVSQKPGRIEEIAAILRDLAREDLPAAAETMTDELNTLDPVLKKFASRHSPLWFANGQRWRALDLHEELLPILSELRAWRRTAA